MKGKTIYSVERLDRHDELLSYKLFGDPIDAHAYCDERNEEYKKKNIRRRFEVKAKKIL